MALGGGRAALGVRRRRRSNSKMARMSRAMYKVGFKPNTMCCQVKKRGRKKVTWKKKVKDAMSSGPLKTNICKQDRQTTVAVTTLDTRTCYTQRINRVIPFASTDTWANGIPQNRRLRPNINIRGWRITLDMLNTNKENPLWFNYAIIQPIKGQQTLVSLDGFFRESETSRDVNFSAGLTGQAFSTLPISPDSFNILMHKRFFIPASGVDAGYSPGLMANTNYRKKRFWVPFKRPVAFDDDDANSNPEKGIFVAYWVCFPIQDATAAQSGVMLLNQEIICFYREQKT